MHEASFLNLFTRKLRQLGPDEGHIHSLNFFKVIFSDNSQSIFKLLCKEYPLSFLSPKALPFAFGLFCWGLDFSCGVLFWV